MYGTPKSATFMMGDLVLTPGELVCLVPEHISLTILGKRMHTWEDYACVE